MKIKITKNIVLRKFCEHSISQWTIVSPKGNKKQCAYPTFCGDNNLHNEEHESRKLLDDKKMNRDYLGEE